jgi:16S rRNA (guanine1207-N2)-methyltransferase
MADPTGATTPFSHYFTGPTDDQPRRPRSVRMVVDGRSLDLVSEAGVFSHGDLDEGTALLIDRGAVPDASATSLADIGCGWGPVALALGVRAPTAEVWAVDTNARATALCATNADGAGLNNVRAVTVEADPALAGLDEAVTFDAIWSNPPVRIGKRALHELLSASLARLRPGGTAHLVVHKHLGSDSLQRWLIDQGYPTVRRLSRHGFRLLDVGPIQP